LRLQMLKLDISESDNGVESGDMTDGLAHGTQS
jgi:hypothetical protein